MRWERVFLPHPKWGITFSWRATSRVLPCHWHIYRRPDHRYDLYLVGMWQGHQEITNPNEGLPLLVARGVPSAPKAKALANLSERVMTMWRCQSGTKPGTLPVNTSSGYPDSSDKDTTYGTL